MECPASQMSPAVSTRAERIESADWIELHDLSQLDSHLNDVTVKESPSHAHPILLALPQAKVVMDMTPEEMRSSQRMFAKFDVDGDGVVSLEDFTQARP